MEPPWQRRLAVRVTRDAERHIKAGHPWVFDRSIVSAKPGEPGDLAVIFDDRRRFLAVGLYDPTSPLTVRILHTGKPQTIDADWLVEAIRRSIALRRPLIDGVDGDVGAEGIDGVDGNDGDDGDDGVDGIDGDDGIEHGRTTAFRLVHGENDGLAGVVIDRYGPNLVMKLYTIAWLPWLDHLLEAAVAAATADVGPVERVVLRLSRKVAADGPHNDGEIVVGSSPDGPVRFIENGLHFQADLLRGHKTGYFLDQRDNRRLIRSLAAGRDVLDVFACTGGFSVHAAAGGAATVLSVDASRPALAAATANMALNPTAAGARHQVEAGDAFAVMEKLIADSASYDLIVIDPPAFAQRKLQVAGAMSAYERLAALAGGLVRPGGLILQASCSSRIDVDQLVDAVDTGVRRAGRRWHERRRTGQPLDHPVSFAEGRYLKAVLLEVA